MACALHKRMGIVLANAASLMRTSLSQPSLGMISLRTSGSVASFHRLAITPQPSPYCTSGKFMLLESPFPICDSRYRSPRYESAVFLDFIVAAGSWHIGHGPGSWLKREDDKIAAAPISEGLVVNPP